MLVKEVMTPKEKLVVLAQTATVREALAKMRTHSIRSLWTKATLTVLMD